jgi:hypothetical protein
MLESGTVQRALHQCRDLQLDREAYDGLLVGWEASTALDRRSECDQSSFRQDLHSCSGFFASDSQ